MAVNLNQRAAAAEVAVAAIINLASKPGRLQVIELECPSGMVNQILNPIFVLYEFQE